MGNSGSLPKDVEYVVVGGGYGGVEFARSLQDAGAKLTLISDRDCFHHNIGAVRAAVTKGYSKKTLLPLKDIFGENFKLGKVVSIDSKEKKLRLESGEEVSYGVLVLATGTTGLFPHKLQGQDAQTACVMYEEIATKVEQAKRILVIGGGATGIEQACEITTKFPDKEVTVIAARDKLITDKTNDNFQKKLMTILNRLKVKVIKEEKIEGLDEIADDQEGPITVTTDKGTEITVDLILKCTGIRVNSDAYNDSLGESVDDRGQLKVDQFFQVEGHDDIFAIGDCNSNEDKLAYAAGEQAKLLISNLKKKNSGKVMSPWQPEKAIMFVTVVALGPTSGLGQTRGGYVLPEFLIRSLKSKDMFVSRYWKENKLTVPK